MYMGLYYVKRDLFGVPRGVVERFHLLKAAPLLAEGSLEAYDPQNGTHRAAAERAGYASPVVRTPIPDRGVIRK